MKIFRSPPPPMMLPPKWRLIEGIAAELESVTARCSL